MQKRLIGCIVTASPRRLRGHSPPYKEAALGLDASVMCNCFRDGKTSPPPVPREWLHIDHEGYLNLLPEHDTNRNWGKFHKWMEACCAHPKMIFVYETISNWPGVRLFQEACDQIGWQRFPVLKAALPSGNGGLMPAADCRQALTELDDFAARGGIGEKTVLVNSATGDVLYEYIVAYDGVFLRTGNSWFNIGLDELGLFAIEIKSGCKLFRATRLRQFTPDGSPIRDGTDDVVWENLETGNRFEAGIAIPGYEGEYPFEMHVEQRPRSVEEFAEIVRALRAVFTAAVETGNPVRWA